MQNPSLTLEYADLRIRPLLETFRSSRVQPLLRGNEVKSRLDRNSIASSVRGVGERAILVGVILPLRPHDRRRTIPWTSSGDWPRRPACRLSAACCRSGTRSTSRPTSARARSRSSRSSSRPRRPTSSSSTTTWARPRPRNLEKQLEVKVVDRTEVILDIFATHARRTRPISRSSWRSSNTRCRGSSGCGPTCRGTRAASACGARAKSSSRKTAGWSGTGSRSSRRSWPRSRRGRSARSPAAATCRRSRWSATPTPARAR